MSTDFKFEKPWIEKYRPISIDDIIIDSMNLKRIQYIIKNKSMPHIIITGHSGIGKTTTILCLAKLLLGNKYNDCVLELNASDDRGIKSVQESMTIFCKKKFDEQYNHKIILLDEADNLTSKAQQLIANLMENYGNTTRFAFTCNDCSDIIDSIQSRCIILKFKKLNNDDIKKRILQICKYEDIKYDDEGINTIINWSNGDLRVAINNLQAVYTGFNKITLLNVNKLCHKPNPIIIKKIIEYCKKSDIDNAVNTIISLKNNGYSGSDIIININIFLKYYDNIDNELRIKYINKLGKTCININKGIDTNLQLYGCLARMCLCN